VTPGIFPHGLRLSAFATTPGVIGTPLQARAAVTVTVTVTTHCHPSFPGALNAGPGDALRYGQVWCMSG
jgi:hypothetical protein